MYFDITYDMGLLRIWMYAYITQEKTPSRRLSNHWEEFTSQQQSYNCNEHEGVWAVPAASREQLYHTRYVLQSFLRCCTSKYITNACRILV